MLHHVMEGLSQQRRYAFCGIRFPAVQLEISASELQLAHTVAADQEICANSDQQNTVADEYHGSADFAGEISGRQASQRHAATESPHVYAHDPPTQLTRAGPLHHRRSG